MNEIRKRMISFGTVYYFLTLIFCREIVLFSEEGVVEKTSQIMTLLFLYFLPIFYCLSYIFVEKAKKKYCEKNGYYRIQIPDNNTLSIAKQNNVFDCLKLIIKSILLCALGVFLCRNISFVNENLMDIWLFVHEEIELNDVLVLAVTVYAAFFALFPILVSYLHKRCIFFDTYDLPDIIKSNKLMRFSLIIFIMDNQIKKNSMFL